MFRLGQPVGPFLFVRKSAAAKGGDLNTKEKMNSSSATNAANTFISAVEALADGAMIQSGLFKLAARETG